MNQGRKVIFAVMLGGAVLVGCQQLPTEPTPIDLSVEQPIARPDTAEVNEDDSVLIDVIANDSSRVGAELELVEIEANPEHGSAEVESGQVRYTPVANFSGIDSLRYVVTGGVVSSTSATYVVVRPVNDPPIAVDDTFRVSETEALGKVFAELDVLANDSDIDGDILTVLRAQDPANGQIEIPEGGRTIVYTPTPDFVGTDRFTYTIQDGNLGLAAANVFITVDPSNDPPVAQNDSRVVPEDELLTVPAPGVLANDSDPDGDPLGAFLFSEPSHGELNLSSDGSFTYQPDPEFNGQDVFEYVASDGNAESAPATVTITVDAINDIPIAETDSFLVNEDTELNVTAPGVLFNDIEPEGGSLTALLESDVSNGTLSLSIDGSFTYKPNEEFNGVDSFVYRASDGLVSSNPATAFIEVEPTNDRPVGEQDSYELNEDEPLTVAAPGVLGNDSDVDGDELTASLQSQPSNGSIELQTDGSFTYTPRTDFSGIDGFTYAASDGVAFDVVAVTLTVIEQNDPPVAVDDSYATPANVPLVIQAPGLLENDSDPESDRLSAALQSQTERGELSLSSDGSFTYTPNAGFSGLDSFTYTSSDGVLESSAATVSIEVTAVGRPPVAGDDFYAGFTDTLLVVDAPGVLDNDVDSDQDLLSAELVEDASTGTLEFSADGSFSYQAPEAFKGIVTFRYLARDGNNVSNVALVQLTIQ